MNANDYQDFTKTTAIYKEHLGSQEAITYCTLGLVGECGEIAEKMKKKIRAGVSVGEFIGDVEMQKELGDCLWYLARLCDELGMTLGDVMRGNMVKLNSRKDRGVLHGEGDNR